MDTSLYEHCVKATILLVSEFLLSWEQGSITLLSFEFFYKHIVLRFSCSSLKMFMLMQRKSLEGNFENRRKGQVKLKDTPVFDKWDFKFPESHIKLTQKGV